MTKCFGVALLALPLLALPAQANDDPFAPHLPYKVETGANFYFRVLSQENGWGCQLGPWYNYWPMEAHFQTPALPYYPYWPSPQTLPPGAASAAPYCPPAVPTAAPAAAAPNPAAALRKPQTQPVMYQYSPYYAPQGPAYWYGR